MLGRILSGSLLQRLWTLSPFSFSSADRIGMKFHHSRETQFPMLLSHVLQYPMRKILIEDYDGNSGQNSLSLVSFEAAALAHATALRTSAGFLLFSSRRRVSVVSQPLHQ